MNVNDDWDFLSDLLDPLPDGGDLIGGIAGEWLGIMAQPLSSVSDMINDIIDGQHAPIDYFAPGRVNLIGEHIDYNGGLVMPIAITPGIKGTFTKHNDRNIYLSSSTHQKKIGFTIDTIPSLYAAENDWCNYPIGVIQRLKDVIRKTGGFSLHYESDLPEGSGISSSAAIEVLTAYIILQQTKRGVKLPAVAALCQKVENEFIGVKCGIMDQFAVANCKKDHALLLNCNTLEFEHIPFELNDYALLVINSRKPRSLIKSAYNERKAESDEALKQLIKAGALNSTQFLADAEMESISLISDEVIRRRARHVISENLRVKHAAAALRVGDLHTFGRLMNASHQSMKEDYEITGIEMDTLAETAQNIDGCLGARMTGGGFGGCAIALVRKSQIKPFTDILSKRYHEVTGLWCEIYACTANGGVGPLNS